MTDVIKIALQRRAELSAELSRLDDFIRMAESLVQDHGAETERSNASARVAEAVADAVTQEAQDQPARNPTARPTVFRQKAHG